MPLYALDSIVHRMARPGVFAASDFCACFSASIRALVTLTREFTSTVTMQLNPVFWMVLTWVALTEYPEPPTSTAG